MSENEGGGLKLLFESFVTVANLLSNFSKRACNSAGVFSRSSQFGDPLPLLIKDHSNRRPKIHENRFLIREHLAHFKLYVPTHIDGALTSPVSL
jgi:hypothetical protein